MADLVIHLKQVKGHRSGLNYRIDVPDQSKRIIQGKKIKIVLPSFNMSLPLVFTVFEGERRIGAVQSPIEELVEPVWLKVTDNIELQVTGKLSEKVVQQSKTTSPTKRRPGNMEKKCPYLEKLAKGIEKDSHVYQNIQNQRMGDPSMRSFVRVTLEPDSPSRASQPLDLPDLEDVNPASV